MKRKKTVVTRFFALLLSLGMLVSAAACNRSSEESPSSEPDSSSSTSAPSSSSQMEPPQEAKSEPVKPAQDKLDKIAEKREINDDVVAWITVPGTDIDDPIIRGENDKANKEHYYERRDINGQYDFHGSYFPDYDVVIGDRDAMSNITILYGHAMDDDPNGRDFSQLKRYLDPEFAAENIYINYVTDDDDMYFKVFATAYTDINLPYFYPEKSGEELGNLIEQIRKQSTQDFETEVNAEDKLLILSTCTYKYGQSLEENEKYRFLICARLLRPEETTEDPAGTITVNEDVEEPVYPFKWATQT